MIRCEAERECILLLLRGLIYAGERNEEERKGARHAPPSRHPHPLGLYSDLQWCCVRDNGCVVGQRRFEVLERLYSLRLQERRLKVAAQLRAKRDASILMDLIDNGMTAMNAVELSQ